MADNCTSCEAAAINQANAQKLQQVKAAAISYAQQHGLAEIIIYASPDGPAWSPTPQPWPVLEYVFISP